MYLPAHAITPHMTRFIYAFQSPHTSLFSFNQAGLLNWGSYRQVPAHLTAETQSPPEAVGAAALALVVTVTAGAIKLMPHPTLGRRELQTPGEEEGHKSLYTDQLGNS